VRIGFALLICGATCGKLGLSQVATKANGTFNMNVDDGFNGDATKLDVSLSVWELRMMHKAMLICAEKVPGYNSTPWYKELVTKLSVLI
jgi:hypothetical protein